MFQTPREAHPTPRGIIRKRKSGVGRGFINEYQFVELDAEVIEKPERGSLLSVPPPERNAERKDEPKGERKPETLDTTIRKEQENHITTEQKQHAYGALRDWRQIKEALRAQLPPDEFNHWVRPLFPLKLMGTTLLLALPPNKAMVCAAKNRSEMLRSLLAERGYDGFCLTHYPDANQRERLRMEYPAFYEQMFGSKVPRREGSTAQAELVEA